MGSYKSLVIIWQRPRTMNVTNTHEKLTNLLRGIWKYSLWERKVSENTGPEFLFLNASLSHHDYFLEPQRWLRGFSWVIFLFMVRGGRLKLPLQDHKTVHEKLRNFHDRLFKTGDVRRRCLQEDSPRNEVEVPTSYTPSTSTSSSSSSLLLRLCRRHQCNYSVGSKNILPDKSKAPSVRRSG